MKATLLKQNNEPHLKVVNNTRTLKRSLKRHIQRIYINTLAPNFSYTNNTGKTIVPKKCVLL